MVRIGRKGCIHNFDGKVLGKLPFENPRMRWIFGT
jgi:hypothetical protein